MKSVLKTKPGDASVDDFLDALEDDRVRDDCRTIARIMKKATKAEPRMWGSIVGFGTYRYKYASGREGEWMLTSFAPRANRITLYVMPGFKTYGALMARLGRYSAGKSCIHIKQLSDIHLPTLEKLVGESVKYLKKRATPR